MTYQIVLEIFSFSLASRKKLSFFQNIYSSSLQLAQISQGQSFDVIQSQIKEEIHVYASDNIFFQINNLMSNWRYGLIPTRRLGKPPSEGLVPKVIIYLTAYGYIFVTLCIYAF